MNYYKGCAIGLILFLGLSTINKAEARGRRHGRDYQELAMLEAYAEESPDNDEGQKKFREKLRRRIDTMKIWQLTEDLDLSDEDWRKFFRIMKSFEEKKNALAKEKVDIKRQLKSAVSEDSSNEIPDLLNKMDDLAHRGVEIQKKELEEMKKILSMKQLAQYALFREKFSHKINKFISKCKERRFERDRHSTQ